MHGIGDEGRLHDDERDDNPDDARAVEELEPRAGHPYAQAFVERVGQRFGREAGKEECHRRPARSSFLDLQACSGAGSAGLAAHFNSCGFWRRASAASAKNPTGRTLTKSLRTSRSTKWVTVRQKQLFLAIHWAVNQFD